MKFSYYRLITRIFSLSRCAFFLLFLEPSVGPDSLSFTHVNKTTFNISWEPLPREKSNGKVVLYELKANVWWTAHVYNCSAHNNPTANTSTTFVVLFGLLICSRYNVSVRGYTRAGPGLYSEPLELVTSSKFGSGQHFINTNLLSYWRHLIGPNISIKYLARSIFMAM